MQDASVVAETGDPSSRTSTTRYDDDAHAWALEHAAFLKDGRFGDLDLLNLADEVADVAHREYDALQSDLARVLQHLLKWDRPSERRSRSWARTIREHRRRITRRLVRSPSLKNQQIEALVEAYQRGRAEALQETDLPDAIFPTANAYSRNEAMTREIHWPAL